MWTGTAASCVDLSPVGTYDSDAHAVHGGQQAGVAFVGNFSHAGIWSGTAASWVDLHTFLPASFINSEARDIWHSGNVTYVAGYGQDSTTGLREALLWMGPAPCPADYNGDGFVDGIDYDQFNNDFEAGNIAADYNGDGFVDGIDYDQFNNDFEAGC
jgi:hypothetical protein